MIKKRKVKNRKGRKRKKGKTNKKVRKKKNRFSTCGKRYSLFVSRSLNCAKNEDNERGDSDNCTVPTRSAYFVATEFNGL